MGHYRRFPNRNGCYVWTRCKLGHMSTSRISIKEIHKRTAQLLYAWTQDTYGLGSSHDKLLGRKFTVVTDHKGLKYFKTQPNLSLRQTRWWEYLSHFNYNTIHVDGTWNQVADSLSHYYEYNTIEDEYPNGEFVKADEILDPDRDLAPVQWFIEIWSQAIRRSQRLQERTPTVRLESQMLNETFNNIPVEQLLSIQQAVMGNHYWHWLKKNSI